MSSKSFENKKRWLSIIAEFEASNKGKYEFCRDRGINVTTFYRWRTKLKRESEKRMLGKASGRFVKVQAEHEDGFKNVQMISRLPDAKWVAEFAAHFVRNLI